MQRIDVSNQNNCCGCGACKFVCPSKAITMVQDKEGYLYPHINEENCTKCGLCFSSCAIQNNKNDIVYNDYNSYAVKHKNHSVIQKSRSGGVFTAISDWIIDKNGVVYGAMHDRPDHVMHFRATNKAERDKLRGSKYVQSHTEDIYDNIKNDLKIGKVVLFSGTPCQCAAVAAVFNPERYHNLYLCDFVCHGVPSEKLLADYLRWIEKKYDSKIETFVFRDKSKFPWETHVEKIILKSKTIFSRRYTNIFYMNACLRPSCYTCKYTKINRITDFTMADYWGIKKIAPSFYDDRGVSLLIVRTEKARLLLDDIEDTIEYIDTSEHKPEHYSLYRPTKKPENRDLFWKDYYDKGFNYVSRKYGGYDFIHRIKHKLIDHYD